VTIKSCTEHGLARSTLYVHLVVVLDVLSLLLLQSSKHFLHTCVSTITSSLHLHKLKLSVQTFSKVLSMDEAEVLLAAVLGHVDQVTCIQLVATVVKLDNVVDAVRDDTTVRCTEVLHHLDETTLSIPCIRSLMKQQHE